VSILDQIKNVGALQRVAAGEYKNRGFEGGDFIDQTLGFIGTQLKRAANRLSASPAMDTRKVACLGRFPNHDERPLVKIQIWSHVILPSTHNEWFKSDRATKGRM